MKTRIYAAPAVKGLTLDQYSCYYHDYLKTMVIRMMSVTIMNIYYIILYLEKKGQTNVGSMLCQRRSRWANI